MMRGDSVHCIGRITGNLIYKRRTKRVRLFGRRGHVENAFARRSRHVRVASGAPRASNPARSMETATPENLVHPPHGAANESPEVVLRRERGELRAAIASLVLGITLLGVKFTAYVLSDSTAISSDGRESIVTVVASAAALYAIWLAHRPADVKHPYGHGKV